MVSPKAEHLSFQMALGLAAPHTWGAASLCPAFLGTALALSANRKISWVLFSVLLAAVVLMHSAVNTLNDYFDFVKGTDTLENSDDPTDAILVYHHLHPRQALFLGVCELGLAAALGIPVTFWCGPLPLLIGLVGGLVLVLYSAGKHPLSYLPIGECVSGFVMGGLIPLAFYIALSGKPDKSVLYKALPMMLGIALVMMTNNTCDIERDILAGRKTLPVLCGRTRARKIYACVAVLWLLVLLHLWFYEFRAGFGLLAVFLALCGSTFWKLCHSPLTPATRGASMGLVMRANLCAGFAYLAVILLDVALR